MNETITYVSENWALLVAVFWMLEKVVKLTPTKYDDILIDIIWGGVRKLVGKGK